MADLFTQPQFASTIKKINPSATDQDIRKAWQVNGPQLAQINPMQAMQETMDIAKNMSTGTLKPIDVTRSEPAKTAGTAVPTPAEIPTTAPNPYAGTVQAAIDPTNPGAAGMSAFEQSELGRQLAQHSKNLEALNESKKISMLGTSFGGNAGDVENFYKSQGDLSKAMTYGPLETKMTAATGAEDLATKMGTRGRADGAYTLSQAQGEQDLAKKKLENVSGAMKVEDEQAYRDPKSVQSTIARSQLKSQAGFKDLPSEIQKGINDQTISANQLINSGFIDPNFLSAYKKVADTSKVGAETGKTQAETGGLLQGQRVTEMATGIPAAGGNTRPNIVSSATPSGPNVVAPPVQQERDRERLRIIKSEYDKEQNPTTKAGLFREMTRIEQGLKGTASVEEAPVANKSLESRFGPKPPMMDPSDITVGSGGSWSVAGHVGQRKQEAQNELTHMRQKTTEYDTRLKPDVQFAYQNAEEFGPGNVLNKFNANIKKREIVAANLNKAAADLGLLAQPGSSGGMSGATGIGGMAGTVIGGAAGGRVGAEVGTAVGSVLGGIASSVGGGTQQISENTNPDIIKEVAAKVAMAQAYRDELSKSMDDYFKYSNGNMNNYVRTDEYKRIMSSKGFISPEGDVKLVPSNDYKTQRELKEKGYTDYSQATSVGQNKKPIGNSGAVTYPLAPGINPAVNQIPR